MHNSKTMALCKTHNHNTFSLTILRVASKQSMLFHHLNQLTLLSTKIALLNKTLEIKFSKSHQDLRSFIPKCYSLQNLSLF